jgi:hypothetical protein
MLANKIKLFVEKYNPDQLDWEIVNDANTAQIETRAEDRIIHSIFAGVNNFHFDSGVGCSSFVPVSQPRGVPENITEQTRTQLCAQGINQYSHSYLRLLDLKDYNWQQSVSFSAFVNSDNYALLQNEQIPTSYEVTTSKQILRKGDFIRAMNNGTVGDCVTRACWFRPCIDFPVVNDFVNIDIPCLEGLSGGLSTNVRLVFYFYKN